MQSKKKQKKPPKEEDEYRICGPCVFTLVLCNVMLIITLSIVLLLVFDNGIASTSTNPAITTEIQEKLEVRSNWSMSLNAKHIGGSMYSMRTTHMEEEIQVIYVVHFHKKRHVATEPLRGAAIADTCSSWIVEGGIWKTYQHDWYYSTVNSNGISASYITNFLTNSFNTWNRLSVPTKRVFHSLRNSPSLVGGVASDTPNGRNEIAFVQMDDDNVIAVTAIYGIFDGPIASRKIIEADIAMNSAFDFCDATEDDTCMDGQSVITHEVGHVFGLGHTDSDSRCADQTMWPTIDFGETKKRSLGQYDKSRFCSDYTCTAGSSPPSSNAMSIKQSLLLIAAATLNVL